MGGEKGDIRNTSNNKDKLKKQKHKKGSFISVSL